MYTAFIFTGGVIMLKKILVGTVVLSALLSSSSFACGCKSFPQVCKIQKNYHQNSLVSDVVKAVSQVGLSARETKRISDGVAEYRRTMKKIHEMKIFPIDSFMNDEFNEEKFISELNEKNVARMAAKAALFKYVFSVLNKEQRRAFKNAYAAPLIQKMIEMNY